MVTAKLFNGSINMSVEEAINQAEKEVAKNGKLTLTSRRRIWQTMGELEPRKRDSKKPRSLTDPLRKRALLALACAKKVMFVWCADYPEDKRPQNLIKKSLAYLDKKLGAEDLRAELKTEIIDDFVCDMEANNNCAGAALSAWSATVVALYDEQDLEGWNSGLTDADTDAYEKDAAWDACYSWMYAYDDNDDSVCSVREMRFWAWYLEEAAKIAGLENYRFPPKYINAFKEKHLSKPVPEEITLESFCDYMGWGEYLYNVKDDGEVRYYNKKTDKYDKAEYFDYYKITASLPQEYGVCPVCKKQIRKVFCRGADTCLDYKLNDFVLPKKYPQIDLTRLTLEFRCPDHPDEWIYNLPKYQSSKAALKRFIKGEGRIEKLIEELERRTLKTYCHIGYFEFVINGNKFESVEELERKKQKLGLVGAEWIDEAKGIYGLDLKQFSSDFYVYRDKFEKFVHYAEQICRNNYQVTVKENGDVEFQSEVFKYTCKTENGKPVRLQIEKLNAAAR